LAFARPILSRLQRVLSGQYGVARQGNMSVARSFLLLSAGIVAGGLSMMTLEGEIDWLRWVRGPRLSNPLPPPAIADVPSLPEPVAALPKQTSPPVPETVIVNLNQPTASIPIGQPAWQGGGRQLPITRELQSELQRVGCYGGVIDGYWSPLSQRSAKAFVEGVNAHLPVGEPDFALLALVRAARSTVCAKPCPPETRPGADSACKPVQASPGSTAISLTRQTPTAEAPIASAQAAPIQAGAAPDPVAAALTPLPPTPQQPRQKAAQQKPAASTTFGVEIFGSLNRSRY
jgi:hypothetical protein